jgi:DNA-binding transcriptional ArsR family regulator
MNEEDRFEENEVYDILRNERRRNVLRLLRDDGRTATIGDLADAIAEAETGESPPPNDTRQSVYVSLHQTHLPKLDNLGVIEYDREERTVELLPRSDPILARLDGDGGGELAAGFVRRVLAVALLGLLLVVATAAAVPELSAPVAVLALAAVAALAGYRLRTATAE